jgi:hypothetical protein
VKDVTCPHCAKTFALDEPVPSARRAPAGDVTCPKCGDQQPEAAACRSCGLLVERMADFASRRDQSVPVEVSSAWDAVEASWDDDAAHEKLMQEVAAATAYPWAAQRYREAQRARPGDRRAAAMLARLVRMTEATLRAGATARPKKSDTPYRRVTTLLAVLLALFLIGVAYTLIMKGMKPEPEPPMKPARPAKRVK